MRNRLGLAGLALLVAAALAAPAQVQAEPKAGGTLSYVVHPEPTALVGFAATGSNQRLSAKMMEGLLKYDLDLTPQPELAREWSVSADGLSYTFMLRDGVKWHDGKPFTSADVAYSIEVLKKKHPRGRVTFANVDSVDATDPLKAVLHLSKPAPFLIRALAAAESPMIPKHLYDVGVDPVENPINATPVGTGPFKFKEWVKGSHVVMERNPDYWDQPKPYLDRVVIRFIPDAPSRAIALETGDVDMAGQRPVPFTDIERLAALPNLNVDSRGYGYAGDQSQLIFNFDNEILRKKEVRQAIAHALDVNVVLNTAWYGRGVIAPSPISPALVHYFDPSIKPATFDIELAERMLDDAGHKRGADGTRFALRLLYNPFFPDPFLRTSQYIRQALAKVGIDAVIESLDSPTYIKRVYTERAFDLTYESLVNTFDPTIGVQRVYWSKAYQPGIPFTNPGAYSNPEVDRLLEAAAVEPDPEKRKQLFFDFQKIVADELPTINLVAPGSFTIYNKRIKNLITTANSIDANFADVYIDETP